MPMVGFWNCFRKNSFEFKANPQYPVNIKWCGNKYSRQLSILEMFAFFCNNKSSSHECSLNLFWIFWENKWHVSLRTFSICITNISFHWNCISLSFTAWCLLFLDLIRLTACWECRVGAEHCNSRLVQIATTQQSKDPCCRFLPLNSCHLIHSTRLHWCNENRKLQCPLFPLGKERVLIWPL